MGIDPEICRRHCAALMLESMAEEVEFTQKPRHPKQDDGVPMIDPNIGFTSDVIREPQRFVGRHQILRDCITAIHSPMGLLAVYGRRGVGKSSLMRQIQQMALGDVTLVDQAGLSHLLPEYPRRYLTVYYSCDAFIKDGEDLLSRLCNDQDPEDGLLRLVPNDGKEISEFQRSKGVHAGADLKVVNWGVKGIETSKYAKVVPGNTIQTFRNFLNSIVVHQVQQRMNRDGLLVMLDEFDAIQDKAAIGSLIKSLTSQQIKFAVCGVGRDLNAIVEDHASVERLLDEGAIPVAPMPQAEIEQIFARAEELFQHRVTFDHDVVNHIARLSDGYPYLAQLFGRACVHQANERNINNIDNSVLGHVLEEVKSGRAFPTLESAYQRAIGASEDRQILLHLLAEQQEDEQTVIGDDVARVFLKEARKSAAEFNIEYVDQLLPRLIDPKFGPVLNRVEERQGLYEFVNPVFRLYVRLRKI